MAAYQTFQRNMIKHMKEELNNLLLLYMKIGTPSKTDTNKLGKRAQ